MNISDVIIIVLIALVVFVVAIGAPAVMARWAGRSHALRAEQVMQHVLPGETVIDVVVGGVRRPMPVTGAMLALGVTAIGSARPLGEILSVVIALGVVTMFLVTHRHVLVARTPDDVVVIETTRDVEPEAVLGRIPVAAWQPTRRWGSMSHPVGDLDIVIVGDVGHRDSPEYRAGAHRPEIDRPHAEIGRVPR